MKRRQILALMLSEAWRFEPLGAWLESPDSQLEFEQDVSVLESTVYKTTFFSNYTKDQWSILFLDFIQLQLTLWFLNLIFMYRSIIIKSVVNTDSLYLILIHTKVIYNNLWVQMKSWHGWGTCDEPLPIAPLHNSKE